METTQQAAHEHPHLSHSLDRGLVREAARQIVRAHGAEAVSSLRVAEVCGVSTARAARHLRELVEEADRARVAPLDLLFDGFAR